MAKGTQWHPWFAQMFKDLVGQWYEVETEVPVSELPRQGDLFVVRRQDAAEPPFTGAWLNLTDWNVFEFKGPTDEAEEEDLDLLIAVGTGLNVRMNEQRKQVKLTRLANRQVSFWYLVPTLGDTFMAYARARATWTYETGGLWQTRVWGHPVWLYAYEDAAVELDALPFFLLNRKRPAPLAVGQLLADRDELLRVFAAWVQALQPALYEEMRQMGQIRSSPVDWEEVAKVTDLSDFVRALPADQVIQILGVEKAIQVMGVAKVFATLGPERALDGMLGLVSEEQLLEMLRQRQQPK